MGIYSPQTKPGLVMAIAIMTLVSGIINLIWGPALVISTFGIGLLCAPLIVMNIVVGAFEVAYAVKLLANPPQPVQPSQPIAIWEIACLVTGNVFAMIVGILSLVFYNDLAVKDYFARLNAGTPPAPPAPPAPAEPPSGPRKVA